ncbi:related to NmrA-like family protein [Cephalotrichum gorgonifer]|uniref:Related to NmrA-like family protein n=1 Tax=Cephalotrichum gorgonifer TaxID=2041049 RepID=A0AAE8MX73_9PEZI|nr:related to NmrA-like family protein [Cephalotrichum gorgonifer]
MSPINTLIFGATGNVGSSAAYAAKEQGANVFLAVRDLTKPLPNLTLEQEALEGFTRVQADLTKPDTLVAAVAATKATRAFVYLAFGTPDSMKSSFEALKSAGVEFVVFLSTSGIRGDPRGVAPGAITFWTHAQVELRLEETFGKGGYVAIRPAFFATNSLWWKGMIEAGDVRLPYPQSINDALVPHDIGRVAGSVLARGPTVIDSLEGEDGKYNAIRLYGPQLLSLEEEVSLIAKAAGKETKVTTVGEDEFVGFMTNFVPEPIARDMVAGFKSTAGLGEEEDSFYAESEFKEASANVEKYSGKPPTTFGEWVEENKVLFK